MNKTSQTVAVGKVKVAGVGDAVVKGGPDRVQKASVRVRGTQSGDPPAPTYRKLNNADPGPKNG